MKQVAISDLKANDVVLVTRPVPSSGGGIQNRFYLGRVVERDYSNYTERSTGEAEVVLLESWFERTFGGNSQGEEPSGFVHFEKDEEGAAAQLLGRWNPETRQVELA